MGHESEDAFVARMQSVLRIACDLEEASAVFNSRSQSSTSSSGSPVVIDSINLPSPRPLLPTLLEAGVSSELASVISQTFQRRAEQFKQHIQQSIATACHMVAEFPLHTSALPPDLFMKRVTSFFRDVYLRRLKQSTEEIIQRIQQASETPTKAASRNFRTFNYEYVPLLEQFFEENPFPTHADKIFLAKKSNMQYKQIHVWFQNRRNRTKKEGKALRKKPTYEGAAKPLDTLYDCMQGYMVDFERQASESSQSERASKIGVAQNSMSGDVFTSSPPAHAFPSPYPPLYHHDLFPCKTGSIRPGKPEWRRVPNGKPPLSLSTDIEDLVERFSRLNVRDGTPKGSTKPQSHAATAAITVIPSCAPHPSLIVRKYSQPANLVQLPPLIRAPVTRSKAFRSPTPNSTPVTLVPLSAPPNKSGLFGRRKIAPLPQRFPGLIRNPPRDTTPSQSSTSCSSPHLFASDSEDRSCSFSSVRSLSTPLDAASVRLFGLPCRSPLDSPIHHCGFGDMVTTSPSSVP